MKSLLFALGLLAAAPAAAYADGWIKCSNPDNPDRGCSSGQSSSIAGALAIAGLVAYSIGRKRRSR